MARSIPSNEEQEPTAQVSWESKIRAEPAVSSPRGSMLTHLAECEVQLPTLLFAPEQWHTLDVDYHPPRVERLYTDVGEVRLSLHVIHPCAAEDALFHPHPWPSAMRVLAGCYEMGVGVGAGEQSPPIISTLVLAASSTYEMTHPDAWHYVRPLEQVVYSVMVTGQPWQRSTPKSQIPLKPLSDDRKRELLRRFETFYPSGKSTE